MRFLTEDELRQVEIMRQLPPDLAQDYIPVSLRLLATQNGGECSPGWNIDQEGFDRIIKSVIHKLDCEILYENYMDGSRKSFRPIKNRFSWSHFEMESNFDTQYDSNSQWVLFPLSHFLFAKDLQKYDIKMRPGYIYFGCKIECASHIHSELLNEMEFWRIREHNPAMGALRWELDIEDGMWHSPKEKSNKSRTWRGPIADIEHFTNSRIVHYSHRQSRRDGHMVYVLETPLEFPPGFVRETANALKRDLPEGNKILERFQNLVFESPAKAPPAADISFPQGVANLHGPDVNWINSSHPWFVQTIVMARLIGGEYWQYALGNLEANMHLCIEDM